MKIALLGYGKMGHEVERICVRMGHEITVIIDSEEDWQQSGGKLRDVEMAIDFSVPDRVVKKYLSLF